MNKQDFQTFGKRLFVAFPHVWEWLNKESPDTKGTLDVWEDVLRPCTLTECLLVLDSWLEGKRPMFKAYERGELAVMIRQAVYFDRAKQAEVNGANRNRFAQSEEERAYYRKTKRGDYRPLDADLPGLAQKFREGRELVRRLKDGELTLEAFEVEKRRLIDSVQ